MVFTQTSKRLFSTLAFGVALVLVGACGTQHRADAPTPPSAPSSTAVVPSARSVIDPQWIVLDDADGAWKVLNREIDHDRQRIEVQPVDETFEYPNECTGCNHPSATAVLTVYARGAYDPAAVYTGREATVKGEEGYYLPPRWPAGAVLAWQYDRFAWATVQGRSQTTGDLARLQDLAERVRPAERTPVRFPLRLTTLPSDMPLSNADTWGGEKGPLTLSFGACRDDRFEVPVAVCDGPSDSLSITIRSSNEFPAHRVDANGKHELYRLPVKIGGRDGFLHEDYPTTQAAIKLVPGVTITFAISGPTLDDGTSTGAPTTRLQEVLDSVVWAAHPADHASWPAVTDWT